MTKQVRVSDEAHDFLLAERDRTKVPIIYIVDNIIKSCQGGEHEKSNKRINGR